MKGRARARFGGNGLDQQGGETWAAQARTIRATTPSQTALLGMRLWSGGSASTASSSSEDSPPISPMEKKPRREEESVGEAERVRA
jgi:hypothetical protein